MRPHLVRLNSTITAEAQLLFNVILILEVLLLLIIVAGAPLLCVAVSRIGSVHKNFRYQICLAVAVYVLGISSRLVLIYYQVCDIPLTDSDPLLLTAELLRDTVIGYYSGLAPTLVFQTLIGTYYWKWYEKGSCSTSLVLLFSETTNMVLAATNASIWLLGYSPFLYNILYLYIVQSLGVSGLVFTYLKNARQLKLMTRNSISYGNYTVDRSFQVRENVLQMKYVVQTIVPAALISSPCFVCFAFNEYGPRDWHLARAIAYAVWDLFFALFRVLYLYLEIRNHAQIWREFNKLRPVRSIEKRRRKNTISEVSSVARGDVEMTRSYFNQFKEAWA